MTPHRRLRFGIASVAFLLAASCATTAPPARTSPRIDASEPATTATPPADIDVEGLAVQQRAALDFACAGAITVAQATSAGTLRTGRRRAVWSAAGCGKHAQYIAVCASGGEESACKAVPYDGDEPKGAPFSDP